MEKTSNLYNVKLHGGVKKGLKQRDLVNEVVLDYIKKQSNPTLQNIQNAFPKSVQKKLEIVVDEFEAAELNSKRKQYHVFDQALNSSGVAFAICNQWGVANIDNFITHAKNMGYEITLEGDVFSRDGQGPS